jgi:hypothetical protein
MAGIGKLLFGCLLSVLGLSACSATKTNGIPRFCAVDECDGKLWRGGQPSKAGWAHLKKLGVQKVVKLNTSRAAAEAAEIRAHGMTPVFLPIGLWQQTVGCPDRHALCSAVDGLKSEKTYVHCTHGEDRTGLFVGLYRVRVQQWTRERAYDEMKKRGFHPILKGLVRAWKQDESPDISAPAAVAGG